jgi:hypothetical protein
MVWNGIVGLLYCGMVKCKKEKSLEAVGAGVEDLRRLLCYEGVRMMRGL